MRERPAALEHERARRWRPVAHPEHLLLVGPQLRRATRERLAHGPAVLIRVESVQGSGPREAGAWMAVFADAVVNTLGGGPRVFQNDGHGIFKDITEEAGVAAKTGGTSLALGDLNGDGYTNIEKYLYGLDPRAAKVDWNRPQHNVDRRNTRSGSRP